MSSSYLVTRKKGNILLKIVSAKKKKTLSVNMIKEENYFHIDQCSSFTLKLFLVEIDVSAFDLYLLFFYTAYVQPEYVCLTFIGNFYKTLLC